MSGGTVGVDFDGVLHGYSKGWKDGSIYDPPVPGALDGLRRLMDQYAVFIFTARAPQQVIPWLEGHGFDCAHDDQRLRFWNERGRLLVTQRKLPARAYLDDRAVPFTTWETALDELLPDWFERQIYRRIADIVNRQWPDLDAAQVEKVAVTILDDLRGRHV